MPCAAAMLFAGRSAREAWGDLHRTSHAHVARMVLTTLEQDLGVAGTEVAAEVARSTGYRVSLYRNGRLWGGTEPPPGPQTLDRALLLDLSANRGGIRMPNSDAVLQATAPQEGTPPAMVALASPSRSVAPAVEVRIVMVLGLLILFSALAGWIQFARRPGPQTRRPGPGSIVTLTMVPALTAVLFLVHLTRTFETTAADVSVRDLTRGLAAAGAREVSSSPESVRRITGFHATLVQSGGVMESTFASDPTEVGGLPAPPRSFTISGRVRTPEGPSIYVALRTEGDAVLVATTPLPVARVAAFRTKCLRIGGGLIAWLLLIGGVLLLRGFPSSSPPGLRSRRAGAPEAAA